VLEGKKKERFPTEEKPSLAGVREYKVYTLDRPANHAMPGFNAKTKSTALPSL
jgi:hypothetical protein